MRKFGIVVIVALAILILAAAVPVAAQEVGDPADLTQAEQKALEAYCEANDEEYAIHPVTGVYYPCEAEEAFSFERPADAAPSTSSDSAIPVGFTADPELVDISSMVTLRQPPADLRPYACFPQDYSEGDDFNRGCAGQTFPWGQPRAGFSYNYNAACRDVSRFCNIPVDTWKWVQITGEEVALPGIGSLRDPDGGAVAVTIVNVWEIPGEIQNAYVLHGFWASGDVWDMSDITTTWDEDAETYTNNVYGSFTLETVATVRDHWLNRLTLENQHGDNMPDAFRGQCSRSINCDTVTWAAVLRWFDGTYHLIGSGQYNGADATTTANSTCAIYPRTNAGANIRSTASIKGEVVGSLEYGSSLEPSAYSNGWFQVGTDRWVSASAVYPSVGCDDLIAAAG